LTEEFLRAKIKERIKSFSFFAYFSLKELFKKPFGLFFN